MTIQTLVSALQQNTEALPDKMGLEADAIIINQCDEYSCSETDADGRKIKVFNCNDRGVGLSRNTALMRADADIVLFSDEDIIYEKGYTETILKAFEERTVAYILIFNLEVDESRRTYFNTSEHKVHWYNCGRYPTYSFACRRERLISHNITFNLNFGGGTPYCNGEDSLFISECLKKGLKAVALPITIGREEVRPSTWFKGYNEKFFFDRGVLYHFLYGRMARVWGLRFILKNKGEMCKEITPGKAYSLLSEGIDHGAGM